MVRRLFAAALIAFCATALVPPSIHTASAATVPALDHVFVIVMENHSYDEIVGSASAPFFNSLPASGSLASNYYGVTHPSLPNYLALTGGSTYGITTDCTTCWISAANIGDSIEGAGKSWKAYMESMPAPCFIGDSYPYMQKHDPFIYFNDIRTNTARCQGHVVPYSAMSADLQSAATTPAYAFITPNACNDMHDCSVGTGDAWLQQQVPQILSSPAFVNQRSLLAITWDEDDFTVANRVPLLLLGSPAVAGFVSGAVYNHYSLLHTAEVALGLPTLTANDAGAATTADMLSLQAPPAPTDPSVVGYLNWYDNATPGVAADFIHVMNPGATPSTGSVSLGYHVDRFTLAPGQETFLTFPADNIGGPVLISVSSGPAVRAWQRVRFNNSWSEIAARPASAAATTQYFPWYDHASAGMTADTIHVLNVSGAPATGSISLPGAAPISFTVPNGSDGYFTFPSGTIGGPVTISSDQPVLATLRGWFYKSLDETPAYTSQAASSALYLPWYDGASAGAEAATIHVADLSGSPATGTISMSGAATLRFGLSSGQDGYFSFPSGTIGGPVTITSSVPVIAELRSWFNQSLDEIEARPVSAAATTQYVPWYNTATPGMVAQTIHVANVGGTVASGTISLPGVASLSFSVSAGQDRYFRFPDGTYGGPLTIVSSQPVLTSLRSWYYDTFNEAAGG